MFKVQDILEETARHLTEQTQQLDLSMKEHSKAELEVVEELACSTTLPDGEKCQGTEKILRVPGPSDPSYTFVLECRKCKEQARLCRAFGMLSPNREQALKTKKGLLDLLTVKPIETKQNAEAMGVLRTVFRRDQWEEPNQSAVVVGPVGTGKTFLAMHALNAIIRIHEKSGLYLPENVFLLAWRAQFHEEQSERDWGRSLVEFARQADYLLLDDFGQSRNTSDGALDAIEELVMRRYDAQLPMLVTSNQPPKSIENSRGLRVWSRLCQMAGRNVVELISKDWRKSDG